MRESFAAALAGWGQTVERMLPGGDTLRWRAFLQPIRRSGGEEMRTVTPLGGVDQRQWLYIGPPDISLVRGDTLAWQGKTFWVREETVVFAGEEPLYCRAVLLRGKEAAD